MNGFLHRLTLAGIRLSKFRFVNDVNSPCRCIASLPVAIFVPPSLISSLLSRYVPFENRFLDFSKKRSEGIREPAVITPRVFILYGRAEVYEPLRGQNPCAPTDRSLQ